MAAKSSQWTFAMLKCSAEWGGRMAAGVMGIVPSLLFFLLASGRRAKGPAAGALKG